MGWKKRELMSIRLRAQRKSKGERGMGVFLKIVKTL